MSKRRNDVEKELDWFFIVLPKAIQWKINPIPFQHHILHFVRVMRRIDIIILPDSVEWLINLIVFRIKGWIAVAGSQIGRKPSHIESSVRIHRRFYTLWVTFKPSDKFLRFRNIHVGFLRVVTQSSFVHVESFEETPEKVQHSNYHPLLLSLCHDKLFEAAGKFPLFQNARGCVLKSERIHQSWVLHCYHRRVPKSLLSQIHVHQKFSWSLSLAASSLIFLIV